MKHEIDNNAMWAAFRQELALQGELQVVAAIDNALNNLGFTIKETSTIIPIPLNQGKNNMGISEAIKKKLEDNLNKALEKETPESCNEFLDEQKPTNKVEPKLTDGIGMNGLGLHYTQVHAIERYVKRYVEYYIKKNLK